MKTGVGKTKLAKEIAKRYKEKVYIQALIKYGMCSKTLAAQLNGRRYTDEKSSL